MTSKEWTFELHKMKALPGGPQGVAWKWIEDVVADLAALESFCTGLRGVNDKLRARIAAEEAHSLLHANINRRAAEALGKPVEGEGSNWSDIPECITAQRARIAEVEGERDDNEVSASIYRDRAERAEKRLAEVMKAYDELLYAVANKFEGETRHETALRYIRERETVANGGQGQAALAHAHEEEIDTHDEWGGRYDGLVTRYASLARTPPPAEPGLRDIVNAFCEGADFAITKIEAHDTFERNWALIEALNRYNGGNAIATPPQKAGGPDWDAPGSMRPPLRSEAEIELASIDELLARRPALADCKTRYDKIAFALRTAARAPEEAQKQGDTP